jgi:hypothetical protein
MTDPAGPDHRACMVARRLARRRAPARRATRPPFRRSAQQADKQQVIEAWEVTRVRMTEEWVRHAQQLARRQRHEVAQVELDLAVSRRLLKTGMQAWAAPRSEGGLVRSFGCAFVGPRSGRVSIACTSRRSGTSSRTLLRALEGASA